MMEIKDLVLHPIQLENVELMKCNVIKDENIKRKISLENMNLSVNSWGKVIEGTQKGYTYLSVVIDFKQSYKPFSIDILYRGYCYIEGNQWTNEQYNHFLEAQGLRLLWPYIKPTVTDLMTRMDIAPLKLPTLDVLRTM